MDLRDILARRRMVRAYRPDPVDPAALERILATVRRAPSAGFSQGHRFLVVTDAATRAGMARLAGEAEYVAMGLPAWISAAPVHVVVGVREESYHERYRREDKLVDGEEIGWPAPYWYVDSGAAFMLLQLAAIDEGLGTGVYGVLPQDVPRLWDLLGMPGDVHFTCVVTIGHPATDPGDESVTSRLRERRLPIDEIVRRERWAPR